MELKEFVSTALTGILEGVKDAQEAAPELVNPGVGDAAKKQLIATGPGWHLVERVEFDVAVTVIDTTSGGVKTGVSVMGVQIGGGASGESSNRSVSR